MKSRRALIALRSLAALSIGGLATSAWLFWPTPQPSVAVGQTYARGDLNLDGTVDLNDMEPYWLAVQRHDHWRTQYKASMSTLLEVADFNRDGSVSTADNDGFSTTLMAALTNSARLGNGGSGLRLAQERPAANGGSRAALRGIDVDTDSNNDDGTNLPEQTEAEDVAEDVSGQPGKIICREELGGASPTRYPVVVAFNTDAANLDCDYGRVFSWWVDYPTSRVTLYNARTGGTQWGDYDPGTQTPKFTRKFWFLGDANGDKFFTVGDIAAFVTALTDPNGFVQNYPCVPMVESCDFDGDGFVTVGDIAGFNAGLSGGWPGQKPKPIELWAQAVPTSSTTPGDIAIAVSTELTNNWHNNTCTTCRPTCATCPNPTAHLSNDTVRMTVDSLVGSGRRWGASYGVSRFSNVDLRTGVVQTTIGLADVRPLGPPLQFALHHSSEATVAGAPRTPFAHVSLGGNWRTSYGGYVRGNNGDGAITLVHDDGAIDLYTRNDSTPAVRPYNPPRGVYNDLRWDAAASAWVLTTPAQSKVQFVDGLPASDGIFVVQKLIDSAGNESVVLPSPDIFDNDYINSAAHVSAPSQIKLSGGGVGGRTDVDFSVEFDNSHFRWDPTTRKLIASDTAQSPDEYEAVLDANSRITQVTDFEDQVRWTYEYDGQGRLWRVRHKVTNCSPEPCGEQFELTIAYDGWNGEAWVTRVTDRRGYEWQYEFDDVGNLTRLVEPVIPPATDPNSIRYVYDTAHNRTKTIDQLGNTWTNTYNVVGGVVTMKSPLTGAASQTWTYAWEQPSGAIWNFYRLDQVTDPLNQWVAFDYAFALDPTLPTCIREVPAIAGGSEAITQLTYYSTNVVGSNMRRGLLESVKDSNRSINQFEYDARGYFKRFDGGVKGTTAPSCGSTVRDGGDRLAGGGCFGESSSTTSTGRTDGQFTSGGGSSSQGGGTEGCVKLIVCELTGGGRSGPALERFGVLPPNQPNMAPLLNCTPSISHTYNNRIEQVLGTIRRNGDELNANYNDYDIVDANVAIDYRVLDPLRRTQSIEQYFAGAPLNADSSTDCGPGGAGRSWEITRTTEFGYSPNELAATIVTPPGGDAIQYFRADGTTPGFDPLRRPVIVERGGMRQKFIYDAAGRVTEVAYGLGGGQAKTLYTYDNANRITSIDHQDYANLTMIKYVFQWRKDNTLEWRDECRIVSGQLVCDARTTFAHDLRKRLIGETRVENGVTIYDLAYTYDQLGNRLSKIDYNAQTQTDYYYDADFWGTLQADAASNTRLALAGLPTALHYTREDGVTSVDSIDNRLIYYIERPISGGTASVTREVWYTYVQAGNVSNIVVKDAGNDWYREIAMFYATNERLWRVMWDRWKGGIRGPFNDYEILPLTEADPKEFYYNGVGGRYLTRPMKITALGGGVYDWEVEGGTLGRNDMWADTLGLTPLDDFSMQVRFTGDTVTSGDQWFNTGGLAGREKPGGSVEYFHGDQVGSITRLSDASGAMTGPAVRYTAFGEVIQSDNSRGGPLPSQYPRYGYVGEHGYESDLIRLDGAAGTKPILLAHVGARWYDAGLGRFVQRDPIGLRGGINAYGYCNNSPTKRADPSGLRSIDDEVDDYIRERRTQIVNRWTDMTGDLGKAFLEGPVRGFKVGFKLPNPNSDLVQFCVAIGWTIDDGSFVSFKCSLGPMSYETGWGWDGGPMGSVGVEDGPLSHDVIPLPGEDHTIGLGPSWGPFSGEVIVDSPFVP